MASAWTNAGVKFEYHEGIKWGGGRKTWTFGIKCTSNEKNGNNYGAEFHHMYSLSISISVFKLETA